MLARRCLAYSLACGQHRIAFLGVGANILCIKVAKSVSLAWIACVFGAPYSETPATCRVQLYLMGYGAGTVQQVHVAA